MSKIDSLRYFGSDPEFSVFSVAKTTELNNNLLYNIPPMSLILDYDLKYDLNKETHKRILIKHDNFVAIEDGAALELNLKPSTEYSEFYRTFKHSWNFTRNFVNGISKDLDLSDLPVSYFDVYNFWETRDKRFRNCVIFGCDPDQYPLVYKDMGLSPKVEYYNDTLNFGDNHVLTGSSNVLDVSKHTLRYFGGHEHIQNMSSNPDIYVDYFDYASIVFDFIVGLTNATFVRNNVQKSLELERLKFYGHPGRARIQKYSNGNNGYEYRPLSNFWLQNISTTRDIINSSRVAAFIVENELSVQFFRHFEELIPDMYSACVTLDQDKSRNILVNVVDYLLKEDIIHLSDVSKYFITLRDYNG